MGKPLLALFVEDDERDVELLLRELQRGGFDVSFERVDTAEAMSAALEKQAWDIILCDYAMPRFDARSALSLMRGKGFDLPFIIVSGTVGEEAAVEAMRAGAHDYFLKDKLGPKLIAAIEREVREGAIRRNGVKRVAVLCRAEERRCCALVETSPLAICISDPHGRMMFANRRAAEIFGFKEPAELLGRDFRTLMPSSEAKHATEILASILRSGEVMRGIEYQMFRTNGSLFWAEVSISATSDSVGKSTWVTAFIEDISNRKKMQEQLLLSDRMVSIGTLAAGVAHEINNPLASVMANLDLAAHDFLARAEKLGLAAEFSEVREELHDARESAERIRNIVRDLKIFSRSSEDKKGVVDVRRVMESTLRMAWNEIRHRARIVKDFGKIPLVEASDSRLGQVFLNLIVNAAQAIEEGRAERNEIRIATSTDETGQAIVQIADTGSGMPAEVLGRLFTPFFTTKPVGLGTGLGLSICQRIIAGLGGSIDVESEVGEGTVFRISLPPARPGLQEDERPVGLLEIVAQRRGKILVVDDEPTIVKVVERTLSVDHEVVALGRADEALKRISAGERYDVILCDLMMPQMTGMELHAELSRVAGEQATRMIFLTGGAFTPRARAFLDETPNQRVEKPFDAMHLRSLINDRIR